MTFVIHSRDTAPEAAHPLLDKIEEKKGFLPNIAGVLASAPPVLEAFVMLQDLLGKATFSAVEKDILFLTISTFNDSPYCQAAFSRQADHDGMTWEMAEAVKHDGALSSQKLEALRQYTLGVLENRGRPSDARIDDFLSAGYTAQNALEILLAITFNTLTNYTARLAHPPLDDALTGQAAPTAQPGLNA